MKIAFSRQILENTERANFMKFRLLVAKSFHVDKQTNRSTDIHVEANNRFWQFCKCAWI